MVRHISNWSLWGKVLLVCALGVLGWSVIPTTAQTTQSDEDFRRAQLKEMVELNHAFGNGVNEDAKVDVFLNTAEIENNKPAVSDVNINIIELSGKKYYYAYWPKHSEKGHWLIDPTTVVAFRISG